MTNFDADAPPFVEACASGIDASTDVSPPTNVGSPAGKLNELKALWSLIIKSFYGEIKWHASCYSVLQVGGAGRDAA